MRFFSSCDDIDINLSKQKIAIGSLKAGFFFSDSTTRQINAKIAVCDTSDRLIVNLLFHHEKALERNWWPHNGKVHPLVRTSQEQVA
jgi:hypothetical protein